MATDPLGPDFRTALEQWGRDYATQAIAPDLAEAVEDAGRHMREHFMPHGADADELDQLVIPTMKAALVAELLRIVQAMQINRPQVQ